MKPLIFLVLLLASCKPLKKLNKDFDKLQAIADKVNTLTPGRDSIVFMPGTTYFQYDTVVKEMPGGFVTREIHVTKTVRDTVTFFNTEKENAFFRENERLKAENNARDIVQDFNDKWLRISVIANGILLIICGILLTLNFKRF